MYKRISKYFVVLILVLSIVIPTNIEAKEKSIISNNIQITNKVMAGSSLEDRCKKVSACNSNEAKTSLLGDVNCECHIAWFLQKILNYIRILGPIIAIVLSSIDFAKTIISSDDDTMKKAQQKLVKRLILSLFLFLIPTLVDIILNLFGITSNTGGIR